jgi:hypothetical protein
MPRWCGGHAARHRRVPRSRRHGGWWPPAAQPLRQLRDLRLTVDLGSTNARAAAAKPSIVPLMERRLPFSPANCKVVAVYLQFHRMDRLIRQQEVPDGPVQVATVAPCTSKRQTSALPVLWFQSPYYRKGRADDFRQAALFHHLRCLDGVHPTPLALLFLQPFVQLVVNR